MLILIHGEDTFSSKDYLNGIIDQFKDKYDPSGTAVSVFDSDESAWEQILEALSSDTLFSKKNLVIAKGMVSNKEMRESLSSFLDSPGLSETTSLIVYEIGQIDKRTKLVKKLVKEKYSKEFSVADLRAIENIMLWRAKELKKTIDQDALQLLSSITGTDVWRARCEVDKLSHLVADRITSEDVRTHTHASIEEEIWEFLDSLGGSNKKRALSLLEHQLSQGTEPMYLLSMLIRQVRLLIALFGVNGDESLIAKNLGLHPFVVKKTRQQASRFSLVQLKVMYQALSRLDSALKTGKGEPKLLFTVLVDSIVR